LKRIISEAPPSKHRVHQQRNSKEPSSKEKRKERQSLVVVGRHRSGRDVGGLDGEQVRLDDKWSHQLFSNGNNRLVGDRYNRLVVALVVDDNRSLVVMVMMVREEAVVFVVLVVLGVTRVVLLLVHADGVLGLVKQRLVGGAGGGAVGGRGVGLLLARELVGGGLGSRLVGVGDHVTVRDDGQLGVRGGRGGSEGAYRWTLSPAPVTVSLTFSVVDLELSGVMWSPTSARDVSGSLQALRSVVERTVVEILAVGVRHDGRGGWCCLMVVVSA
jgi:hypothetical protein